MQLEENYETSTASEFIKHWESKQERKFIPMYATLRGVGIGVYGLPHFRNSRAAQEIY